MDRWKIRHQDGEKADRYTDSQVDRYEDERVDGRMDGRNGGFIEGWIDRWFCGEKSDRECRNNIQKQFNITLPIIACNKY